MGRIYDGRITQAGDRVSAAEVQEFRNAARRSATISAVDGVTVEVTPDGTHILLDDTIRNPDHINDWFLGVTADKPEVPEGQPEWPDLHGAMYYVKEVTDVSTDPNHFAVTETQPLIERWLFNFSDEPITGPGPRPRPGSGGPRAAPAPGSGALSPRAIQKRVTGPARLVVAANLAEMSVHTHRPGLEGEPAPEPDGAGLPPGMIVKVFMAQSLDGRPRYYFSSGGQVAVQQFRIITVTDTSLLCKTWDGEVASEELVNVWKPWTLRVSRQTYTFRTRTYEYVDPQSRIQRLSTGAHEEQVTNPPYHGATTEGAQDGDILYATWNPRGGIASHDPGDEWADVGGNSRWLDDNRDGRAWARKHGT